MDEKLQEVSAIFRLPGTYLSYEPIQVGIVNRTYKVNFDWTTERRSPSWFRT